MEQSLPPRSFQTDISQIDFFLTKRLILLMKQLQKEKIQVIRKMKSEIENSKTLAEKYEREGDLGKVAELRYGKIVNIEKQLHQETKALTEIQIAQKMLKEEVDAEDIAEIVSKLTGIPVNKML